MSFFGASRSARTTPQKTAASRLLKAIEKGTVDEYLHKYYQQDSDTLQAGDLAMIIEPFVNTPKFLDARPDQVDNAVNEDADAGAQGAEDAPVLNNTM